VDPTPNNWNTPPEISPDELRLLKQIGDDGHEDEMGFVR
jgi:hypothetical protein